MKKIKEKRNKIYSAIIAILIFLNILILFECIWLEKNVGTVSMDEIIFHIIAPSEGTSADLIKDNIIYCFLPTIFLSIVLFIILFKSYKYKFVLVLEIAGKEIKMLVQYIFLVGLIVVNVLFLIWRIEYIDSLFGVRDYIKSQSQKSTFIEENYVNPKKVKIEYPENKRNLIYIYMESMETSFSNVSFDDKTVFNLIPKLEELANDNISFSDTEGFGGAYQVTGTGWTAAGMIAQTAGLPLNMPIDANEYVGYDYYMPSVYTLGDILKDARYNQEIMMGSDSTFAGKNVYYKTHGDYKIKDLTTARKEGIIKKNYYKNWGFEDGKLFSYAKSEILKLSEKDEPFNFTLLTSNTHFPDGYIEKSCEEISEENSYASSIYCSQEQIYEFVNWIKEQDFFENTTIILVGDHLTMANNDIVTESYRERRIYNAIINSAVNVDNSKNRAFSSLDLFPTTLASLGFTIENNKLGLGVNLFSNKDTIIEENGYDFVNTELSKKSDYYNNFIYNN